MNLPSPENSPRFVMIGGFLGAGKTTTMSRLAGWYRSQGHRIVIVTNDQASDLVDTLLLRSQGFSVGEVAGSCFCCNFNELTDTVERLAEEQRPDIVLAEPVGSCTDLVATVIRPLEHVYSVPFRIAPYGVILKPNHGLRILRGGQRAGFSPQAEYIFRKQLEESDFVIINRIDELSRDQLAELRERINSEYPGRPIVEMSALTGDGFMELTRILDRNGAAGVHEMEVDYDVYAKGEAELGWLNTQLRVEAAERWSLDAYLLSLVDTLRIRLDDDGAETAHLKVIGMSDGFHAVANLTSRDEPPRLSLESQGEVQQADLVINARVATSPSRLEEITRQAIGHVDRQFGATSSIHNMQTFRPGRPVPTHRM